VVSLDDEALTALIDGLTGAGESGTTLWDEIVAVGEIVEVIVTVLLEEEQGVLVDEETTSFAPTPLTLETAELLEWAGRDGEGDLRGLIGEEITVLGVLLGLARVELVAPMELGVPTELVPLVELAELEAPAELGALVELVAPTELVALVAPVELVAPTELGVPTELVALVELVAPTELEAPTELVALVELRALVELEARTELTVLVELGAAEDEDGEEPPLPCW